MKVYELMNTLSSSEAGAEVKISAYITEAELKSGGELGDGLYGITLRAEEINETDGAIFIETSA